MILKKKIDLVILVGGKGSRINRYTKKVPKPLIKFDKIAFVKHLMNYYSKYNFANIYLLAGYKGNTIKKNYDNKLINLIPIKCIVEKKKLGTGGALSQLKNKINNDFIVINGDSFIPLDLDKFINQTLKKKKIGSILVTNNKNYKTNKKLSTLSLNRRSELRINGGKLMNAGVYYFKKKFLNIIERKHFSLENDILPVLIKNDKLQSHFCKQYFIDIGTYINLKKAKKILPSLFKKPAVFFDRDGVINEEKNYVFKKKQFIFKKNVLEAIKFLNKKNIYVFIVTNQAGIAKGYYSEKQFLKLQKYVKFFLIDKKIYINDIRYCPYHKNAIIKKYKKDSKFRKPGNLMINDLFNNWSIIRNKSFMIGDKMSDQLCAKNSSIYFEFAENDLLKQIKKITKKLKI
jgi:D-glycero-D-manno-heptose 1,7-bisphosphate phosphatase